jgi:hypothetical protein
MYKPQSETASKSEFQAEIFGLTQTLFMKTKSMVLCDVYRIDRKLWRCFSIFQLQLQRKPKKKKSWVQEI